MRAALLSLCLLRAALWCLFPVASKNKRKEVWEHIFIFFLWPCLWWFSSTYQTQTASGTLHYSSLGWRHEGEDGNQQMDPYCGFSGTSVPGKTAESHGSRPQNLAGTDWDGRPQNNCPRGFCLSLSSCCSGISEGNWFRALEGRVRNSPAPASPRSPEEGDIVSVVSKPDMCQTFAFESSVEKIVTWAAL